MKKTLLTLALLAAASAQAKAPLTVEHLNQFNKLHDVVLSPDGRFLVYGQTNGGFSPADSSSGRRGPRAGRRRSECRSRRGSRPAGPGRQRHPLRCHGRERNQRDRWQLPEWSVRLLDPAGRWQLELHDRPEQSNGQCIGRRPDAHRSLQLQRYRSNEHWF